MQTILNKRFSNTVKLKDPVKIRQGMLSLFRITLQHLCLTLAEWSYLKCKKNNTLIESYNVDINQLYLPADGSLHQIFGELLIYIASNHSPSFARFYFEKNNISDNITLCNWLNKKDVSLHEILHRYISDRNDSVEGHGIADEVDGKIDIEVIKMLIEKTEHLLPCKAKDSDSLLFPRSLKETDTINSIKLVNGNPLCYRKIKKTTSSELLITAQIQLSVTKRSEYSYTCTNSIFGIQQTAKPEYKIYESDETNNDNNDWTPFYYLPERSTTEEDFTGRDDELDKLREWFNEVSESKRCMVYGDGGVGKTTLIIEFLHRVLEGKIKTDWKPDFITFYTSKLTRWGISGLEQISISEVGISDVVLNIAKMISLDPLDKSWYKCNVYEAIRKLKQLQGDNSIKWTDHLIILDNTETLAQNNEEINELAKQIKAISKDIGRVILTSRRFEKIEASPLETNNWSDEEGSLYLQKRGTTLRLSIINQAGASTLKKISRELSNKPLALEVFIQSLMDTSTLDDALLKVKRLQQKDLGLFLFADAWDRFNLRIRHFLLLMAKNGEVHDQYFMQLCCEKADVSLLDAQQALEGSRGICTLNSINGTLQIVFTQEFINFCKEKTVLIDSKEVPSEHELQSLNRRYSDFLQYADSKVTGKETKAYFSRYARAAKEYFKQGKTDLALEYYELATIEDPSNGWLFDKYANTLFIIKNYPSALIKAEKASRLLPDEGDIWFTKGKIEARLGYFKDAIQSLDRAIKFKKPYHLCMLQKSYAYYYTSPVQTKKAWECYIESIRDIPLDSYYVKFIAESDSLRRHLENIIN